MTAASTFASLQEFDSRRDFDYDATVRIREYIDTDWPSVWPILPGGGLRVNAIRKGKHGGLPLLMGADKPHAPSHCGWHNHCDVLWDMEIAVGEKPLSLAFPFAKGVFEKAIHFFLEIDITSMWSICAGADSGQISGDQPNLLGFAE